jgi:hypothetical protein
MIKSERSIDALCVVASSNIITQAKYWTTNKGFKIDEKLINQKLPFVPLIIPKYTKYKNA